MANRDDRLHVLVRQSYDKTNLKLLLSFNFNRGTQLLFSVKYLFEEKNCFLEISSSSRKAKNFQMAVPCMYDFRSLSINFSTTLHSPNLALICEKGTLNFRFRKCDKNGTVFVTFKVESSIFGKVISKP